MSWLFLDYAKKMLEALLDQLIVQGHAKKNV